MLSQKKKHNCTVLWLVFRNIITDNIIVIVITCKMTDTCLFIYFFYYICLKAVVMVTKLHPPVHDNASAALCGAV